MGLMPLRSVVVIDAHRSAVRVVLRRCAGRPVDFDDLIMILQAWHSPCLPHLVAWLQHQLSFDVNRTFVCLFFQRCLQL